MTQKDDNDRVDSDQIDYHASTSQSGLSHHDHNISDNDEEDLFTVKHR